MWLLSPDRTLTARELGTRSGSQNTAFAIGVLSLGLNTVLSSFSVGNQIPIIQACCGIATKQTLICDCADVPWSHWGPRLKWLLYQALRQNEGPHWCGIDPCVLEHMQRCCAAQDIDVLQSWMKN